MAVEPAVPLMRVTRGGEQDVLFRGCVAVVDDTGSQLFSLGDGHMGIHIRSSAKSIQCIPIILSGAADAFKFDDDDIAIISGSHVGEAAQVAQVRSILAKCGLDEKNLMCGGGIGDWCSGKHAGMLACSKHLGLPLDTYTSPTHPHQQKILEFLRSVCLVEGKIPIAIDGCSAPIHFIPLHNAALGYARMSRPERHFEPATAAAISRITNAVWNAPDGHTGEPLFREILHDGPRILAKEGGSGFYCCSIIGRGVGFGFKIESGDKIPLRDVLFRMLRRLDVISDSEHQALVAKFGHKVLNRYGQTVGEVEMLF